MARKCAFASQKKRRAQNREIPAIFLGGRKRAEGEIWAFRRSKLNPCSPMKQFRVYRLSGLKSVTSEHREGEKNAAMPGLPRSKVEKFASDVVQPITPTLVLSSVFRCRIFLLPIPQIGSLERSLLCAQSLDLLRGFGGYCVNHTLSIGHSLEND